MRAEPEGLFFFSLFLTGLLIVKGFSLCFILSNMSTVYMYFADKKREMNWQTLLQTRQESSV